MILVVGMISVTAGAQSVVAPSTVPVATVVEPPAPLLPTNDRLIADDARAGVPTDKAEVAAILVEDGLKRSETRAIWGGGWVRAYQFGDATGAFSAYTYFRQGGKTVKRPGIAGPESELADGEVVLVTGVSVVRAKSAAGTDAVLAEIVAGLPKVAGPKGLAPLLPTLFPKDRLDADGLTYALGPVGYKAMGGALPAAILGWDKSAEVATASYRGHGNLTLLLYPTPQIAGDRGRAIEGVVNEGVGAYGAGYYGTVKLKRLGALVEMTSGRWSADDAQKLVDSVKLNQEVTFDKEIHPSFHGELKKTYTLLQEIAVFCGLGALAAIVLGVFLGGGRAVWRVMHGKSAASDPEFLSIDLRSGPEENDRGKR
jgi:hypothetical protein